MESIEQWKEFEAKLPEIIAEAKNDTDGDKPVLALMYALREHYCPHCGREYDGTEWRPCQCSNDE